MAVKLGYAAIEYVLRKELAKKGVKGITTIPGKTYDMRMKQLVDAMADKMRNIGYDVNNVTEKQVQGLLNYAEAMEKQRPGFKRQHPEDYKPEKIIRTKRVYY